MITKRLILMVGVPGSGKSTFAKYLINSHVAPDEYAYICPDDIREELSGEANNQRASEQAWKLTYERLEQKLNVNNTDNVATQIIFDAVLANPRTRKRLVNIARKYKADIVYIIMATPLSRALERNKSRRREVSDDVIINFMQRLNNEFPFILKDRDEQ